MQEREAEFEAEQERIRREKEKETARLRAMQERAQDRQAEQVSAVLAGNVLPRRLTRRLPHHPPAKWKVSWRWWVYGGTAGTWSQLVSWSSAGRGAGREAKPW